MITLTKFQRLTQARSVASTHELGFMGKYYTQAETQWYIYTYIYKNAASPFCWRRPRLGGKPIRCCEMADKNEYTICKPNTQSYFVRVLNQEIGAELYDHWRYQRN